MYRHPPARSAFFYLCLVLSALVAQPHLTLVTLGEDASTSYETLDNVVDISSGNAVERFLSSMNQRDLFIWRPDEGSIGVNRRVNFKIKWNTHGCTGMQSMPSSPFQPLSMQPPFHVVSGYGQPPPSPTTYRQGIDHRVQVGACSPESEVCDAVVTATYFSKDKEPFYIRVTRTGNGSCGMALTSWTDIMGEVQCAPLKFQLRSTECLAALGCRNYLSDAHGHEDMQAVESHVNQIVWSEVYKGETETCYSSLRKYSCLEAIEPVCERMGVLATNDPEYSVNRRQCLNSCKIMLKDCSSGVRDRLCKNLPNKDCYDSCDLPIDVSPSALEQLFFSGTEAYKSNIIKAAVLPLVCVVAIFCCCCVATTLWVCYGKESDVEARMQDRKKEDSPPAHRSRTARYEPVENDERESSDDELPLYNRRRHSVATVPGLHPTMAALQPTVARQREPARETIVSEFSDDQGDYQLRVKDAYDKYLRERKQVRQQQAQQHEQTQWTQYQEDKHRTTVMGKKKHSVQIQKLHERRNDYRPGSPVTYDLSPRTSDRETIPRMPAALGETGDSLDRQAL